MPLFGTVTGQFKTAIVDSLDAGNEPDLVPLAGKVSFTLNAARVVDNSGATPVILAPTTIVGVLDAEGYLSTPDSQGGSQYQGLWLPANNDPNQNPTETQWQVTYDLQVPVTGRVVTLPPHLIYLPAGTTINLGAFIPPDPAQPLSAAQAEALLSLAVRTINGVGPDEDGNVIVEGGGGPGGPIAIADVTGLQTELDAKALNSEVVEFVGLVNGAITDLSTEVGTKATQQSVNALSDAQVTLAGNLDSTFALANGANTTANEAKGKADTAVQPTDPLMIKGIITEGETPTGPSGFYIVRPTP